MSLIFRRKVSQSQDYLHPDGIHQKSITCAGFYSDSTTAAHKFLFMITQGFVYDGGSA